MITEWRFKALIIAKDRTAGDAMYEMLRAFPNDPMPEESMFSVPLSDGAWACDLSVKENVKEAISELNLGLYPELLLSKGKTTEEIDAIRNIIIANTYDLFPDGKTYTEQLDALDNFISANGYAKL